MNTDKIQQLEKNDKFKRKFYSKEVWRSYAIVPPSGILFVALFGLLYLFNIDKLISLYAIPFIILLLLSTVWLKAIRKYIIDQKISESNVFIICLSIPLIIEHGKTIMIFSVGSNRLNKHYLEKKKKEVLEKLEVDSNFVDLTSSNKSLISIESSDIYIIRPSSVDRFLNKSKMGTVNRYVVFDNSAKIQYITEREMARFVRM